jgi:hypothetical protein
MKEEESRTSLPGSVREPERNFNVHRRIFRLSIWPCRRLKLPLLDRVYGCVVEGAKQTALDLDACCPPGN